MRRYTYNRHFEEKGRGRRLGSTPYKRLFCFWRASWTNSPKWESLKYLRAWRRERWDHINHADSSSRCRARIKQGAPLKRRWWSPAETFRRLYYFGRGSFSVILVSFENPNKLSSISLFTSSLTQPVFFWRDTKCDEKEDKTSSHPPSSVSLFMVAPRLPPRRKKKKWC